MVVHQDMAAVARQVLSLEQMEQEHTVEPMVETATLQTTPLQVELLEMDISNNTLASIQQIP